MDKFYAISKIIFIIYICINYISNNMELEFIGTGPYEPIRDKSGKSNREQTSILFKYIEPDKKHTICILLDCNKHSAKYVNYEVDYIIVTHAHSDSVDGLPLMKRGVLYCPLDLYDKLNVSIDYTSELKIKGLSITPFSVIHDDPTYGYKFEFADTSFIYASDMLSVPSASEKYFKNVDLAMVDGAGWTRPVFKHQSIMGFLKWANKYNIKMIYFIQIGRMVPPHDKAEKEIQKVNPNAYLAYDGLILQLI